jgi:hypothetical protein
MDRAPPLIAAMVAASLIAAANSALAQEERIWRPPSGGHADGDIQLYRLPNFSGPHIRAQTTVRDLGITWSVRSIRVNSGRWRVCSDVNFGGTCRNVSASMAVVISPLSRIRSVDPIAEPSAGGGGPSLRGMASTFYTRPAGRNGQRIAACRGSANAACARETAAQFCRGQGYNHVGNVALETVGGRVYLADVLCKRSAA